MTETSRSPNIVSASVRVYLAGGESLQRLGPLGRALGAQQQGRPYARPCQVLLDLAVVLAGEDFGGGHDGCLLVVGHRGQGGVQRHHRLAGAHVALEQAVHGPGPGQVGGDLAHGPVLGASECEGKPRPDAAVDFRADRQRPGGSADAAHALEGDTQLHQQELIVGHPAAGAGPLVLVFRAVHGGDGAGTVQQVAGLEVVLAEPAGEEARDLRQGVLDDAGDDATRQDGAGRVHRQQLVAAEVGALRVPEDLHPRVDELDGLLEDADPATDDQVQPGLDAVPQVAAVEPLDRHPAGAVVDGAGKVRPPAEGLVIGLHHHAGHGGRSFVAA